MSPAAFPGRGGCANCLPNLVSPRCSQRWRPRALPVPPHGCRVRQAPPWASAPCQFSVSWAAFQPGRSEDLLEYRLLAFSLASELFVVLTDMKIAYQRGMTLLLSKKSGFHLSSERAVMMVSFFPITSLNFSCAVVPSVGLGTDRLCHKLLEALCSFAQPCTSETGLLLLGH